MGVTVAKLKQAVDKLNSEEPLELAEYLRWRSRQDDPDWQAEIGKRLDRCLSGESTSAEDLLRLHEKLSKDGR